MQVACRSPQQIVEDEIVQLHSDLTSDLRQLSAGRLLYTGRQATLRKHWLDLAARAIESGDTAILTSRLPPNTTCYGYVMLLIRVADTNRF